ncbi:MAG TPA: hypothetical protein VEC11_13875 [Allosphingosinicella sp.]|nr:hypothetical protein [Allosphingosinicella sp.]
MSVRARRLGWAAGGAGLVILVGFFYVSLMGSAVVVDRKGQVLSAAIVTSDGRTQALLDLPGGYFFAIPRIEGTIELRCRDGLRPQWGYVTGHMHTRLDVEPGTGCGRIVERF